MKRVVVGLSGGVDSSVAALLLKEQGYDVIGVFMRNWHDESVILDDECPWIEDSNDAILVAEKLGIPYQVIDLSKEYKERIVDYMFKEYQNGRTPNPDILCNREIKFDLFLKAALQLKADYVATGHYCQKTTTDDNGKETHHLLAGADKGKDQSYFLCQLDQFQLSKAMFPIGHLQKNAVRELAAAHDLVTADKKDSQGLCFIGKVKLPTFLQQELEPKTGDIVEIPRNVKLHSKTLLTTEDDKLTPPEDLIFNEYDFSEVEGSMKVGQHNGAHYFTVGQRKGINVGGKKLPLFVLGTDTQSNIIYVGQGEDHPGLMRDGLVIKQEDVHWLRTDLTLQRGETKEYNLRIRYRQPLRKAKLTQMKNDLIIHFQVPEKSIAKGQFAAWYQGEELIGSGVIS
ncbi:MAG: tRNA 2-thiouridine(34) synthase MnmA [Flavobacteriales bacterium]